MAQELDLGAARASVFDPRTSAAELAAIAQTHPELRDLVVEHPNADPGLRAWVAGLGVPDPAHARSAIPVTPRPVLASRPPAPGPAGVASSAFAPPSEPLGWPPPEGPEAPRRPRAAVIALAIVVALALVAAAVYVTVIRPTRDIAPWSRVLGGAGNEGFQAVAVAPDGRIVAVGATDSQDGPMPAASKGGNFDAVVAAFAADGTLEWTRVLGGAGDDSLQGVAVTSGGDIVAVGSTTSAEGDFGTCTMQPACGAVVRLSSGGTVLWSSAIEQASLQAVAIRPAGDIVAVGQVSTSDGSSLSAVFLLGADGTQRWQKTHGEPGGGWLTAVAARPSGEIVAAGFDTPLDPVGADALLVAFTPDGDEVWSTTLSGAGYDMATGVVVSTRGDVFLAGITYSDDGDFVTDLPAEQANAFVARLTPDGTPAWVRVMGAEGDDALFGLALTRDDRIVAAGLTQSASGDFIARDPAGDGLVAWLTPDGTLQATRFLGGTAQDAFRAVAAARDGDLVVVGTTSSADGDFPPATQGYAVSDALAARLSPDGTPAPT